MSIESVAKPTPHKRPFKLKVHHWLRWLHIYISMFCLLIVMFFAITGITLNHPEWIFGGESKREYFGSLPSESLKAEKVDWLPVVEYLRHTHNLRGIASDMREDEVEGSLTFKAPAYSADCFFDRKTGKYQVSVLADGFVATMNDLHRGRDSGAPWSLLIDLSGGFLVVVTITGFGILLFLKKMRKAALITATVGIVVLVALMYLAM